MIGNINQILYIAESSMKARTMSLDVVSANLANINTTAFKNTRVNFQEVLNQQNYSGVGVNSTQRMMTQGPLKNTGNPLDVAIQGEGYFAVTLPNGETGYTRDGEFTLDANKDLVTSTGLRIVWDGDIPAEADEVAINTDGTVMVRSGDVWTSAGSIPLHRFANPGGLLGYGQNVFLVSENSGEAVAGTPGSENYGFLTSEALEQANVDMATEMTRLISLQRGFEMSLTSFQTTDEMLRMAIQMRRD